MNEQQKRAIVEGLRALAATTKNAAASPHVEHAVLAEMGRLKPALTGDGRPRESEAGAGFSRLDAGAPGWFAYAAAAALFLASISGAWLAREAGGPKPGPIHPGGFVEIPGASTLPPMESGSIVRVALPVTILPQYGLAILPDVANDMVEAELLIAQDGLPRMIRLAQNDSTRSTP